VKKMTPGQHIHFVQLKALSSVSWQTKWTKFQNILKSANFLYFAKQGFLGLATE
jgi:hypothetical protein